VSPLYETEPWGVAQPQPAYRNAVARVETQLAPLPLLRVLKGVERAMGRNTDAFLAPREIDLDILLHGDLVMSAPELTLPHPRLHARAFVLAPLADLAPDLVVPGLEQRVRDLLAALPAGERAGVHLVARDWA
jgi:2-amino-4-hydroxy-6-hydroxymethyldihydropteridine diphosphokinase